MCHCSELRLPQAVCNKEQDRDYKQWVDWLQDSRVTSPVKLEQLQRADDNGFTALHYAILHYTPDLLYTALEVDEGSWIVYSVEGILHDVMYWCLAL